MNKKRQNAIKQFMPYLVLLVIITAMLLLYGGSATKVHELNTGEFLKYISDNKVTEMTITPKSDESVYYITGKIDGYSDKETFSVKVVSEQLSTVTSYAETHNLNLYDTNKDPGSNLLPVIIMNVLPIIVIVAGGYVLFMKMSAGNNKSMDFGRQSKIYGCCWP